MRRTIGICALLFLTACGPEAKTTIGTPGSFDTPGDGVNLRSNLRSSTAEAIRVMDAFPAVAQVEWGGLLSPQSPMRAELERLGGLLSQGDARPERHREWAQVTHATGAGGYVHLGAKDEHLVAEFFSPALGFARLFRAGEQVHVLLGYQGAQTALVYSLGCRGSVLSDSLGSSRQNGEILTGEGAACAGLVRYRPSEVPGLARALSSGDPAAGRLISIRSLEEFYENL